MALSYAAYSSNPLLSSPLVGGWPAKEHIMFNSAFTANFLFLVHGSSEAAEYMRIILGTAKPPRYGIRRPERWRPIW